MAMADESSLRAARQKALAEKKRRLEEIKARRNTTNTNTAATTTTAFDEDAAAGAKKPTNNNANLDSYIDDLLKSSTPGLSLASVSAEEEDEEVVVTTPELASPPVTTTTAANASSTATAGAADDGAPVAATALVIQPRVVVETFEVAIQCEEEDFPPPSLIDDDEEDDDNDNANLDESDNEGGSEEDDDNEENNVGARRSTTKKKSSAITTQTSPRDDGIVKDANDLSSSSGGGTTTIFLTPEEKSKLFSSKPFTQFLSTASRRVERLLGSNDADVYGILKGSGWGDVGGGGMQNVANNNNEAKSTERGSAVAGIDFSVDYANDDDDDDDDEDGQYSYDEDVDDADDMVTDGVSSASDARQRQQQQQQRRRRRRRRRRPGGKSNSQSKSEAYQRGGYFTARATYEFPKFTHGRCVTDIEWCPGHGEWVLASYNAVVVSGGGGRLSATGGEDGATISDGDTIMGMVGVGGVTASSLLRNNPTTRHLSPHDPSSSFLQKTTTTTTTTSSTSSSSYHYTSSIPDEGIVAIYNLAMPSRPEHLFCAGCPILHSQFHPTEHPRLIVGGGSSGQVLVWDARAGRYPVQRSSAPSSSSSSGGGGHNCELVGMKVLGNIGGGVPSAGGGGGGSISTSKLVTASSDGKVSYWAVSNLREPVENVMVDANLSCLDVLHGDSANNESVVCGDERGGVHAIFPGTGRDGSSSNKRVIRKLHPGGGMGISDPSAADGDADAASAGAVDELADIGHFGMVTSVATRPAIPTHGTPRGVNKATATSSKGFVRGAGGLMVTTGVDWSTKLWAPAYCDRPLMSFLSNSYDYMCDAQW
jgi:hypothetical protein